MNIKSDSLVNSNATDAVNLPLGASIPSGKKLNLQGNANFAGISTVGFLSATNANIVGIVTATSFIGDGSGLINVPTVSSGKSIALRLVIGDHPHRS